MTDKVNESKQQAGASARTVCIDIARQLSDIVKHTLGPSGLDNMLVDAAKDVVITNDGATIMKESDIDHPVAKVIMDVARTQEEQCFDGTTSSIILTGALMEEASTLLKSKIHPTKIAIGYQIAAIKAEELLMDMGVEVNEEILDKVAQTAMTGKSAEPDKEHLQVSVLKLLWLLHLPISTLFADLTGRFVIQLLSLVYSSTDKRHLTKCPMR